MMSVTTVDDRAYAAKVEEYLEAAEQDLEHSRHNAATSAAVQAGINVPWATEVACRSRGAVTSDRRGTRHAAGGRS